MVVEMDKSNITQMQEIQKGAKLKNYGEILIILSVCFKSFYYLTSIRRSLTKIFMRKQNRLLDIPKPYLQRVFSLIKVR